MSGAAHITARRRPFIGRRGRLLGWTRLALILSGAAVLSAGCKRPAAAHRYESLDGAVDERNSETGDLRIRIIPPSGGKQRSILCQVTDDSEIYVNDRLASIESIKAGDVIRVVGYRDPNPRLERFVVAFARINRPQTPPAAPEFFRAALRSANRIEEP